MDPVNSGVSTNINNNREGGSPQTYLSGGGLEVTGQVCAKLGGPATSKRTID